jgi:branched-chain amino acid aminotransferase
MKGQVSFNLQILPAEKTFISAVSSAALYGKSIFTTLAVYDAKPFLWEKHWRRLQDTAAKLGIDLIEFRESRVKNALTEIIFLNNLKKGRARVTFFDESTGRIWNFDSKNKTSLLISTAASPPAKDGLRLTVSPFTINSKSPLAGLKSGNYTENLLALEKARSGGFDEAIRLNEKDEIVSAAMANVFWVKRKKIFTPPLETGCLAGTTRALLLENFPIEERSARLDELRRADEIFLTSAGIGVKSVQTIDEKAFGDKVTEELKEFFEKLTQN